MLIASAPTKTRLEKLINDFYYSVNWFINDKGEPENKKTGKILGEVKKVKNRYQYHR